MALLKKIGNYIWSKNFVLNSLAIVLVYFLGYYLVQSMLSSRTNLGQKIEVPNLLGKNQNNLDNIFAESEITYEILDSLYYPDMIEGTIVEQDPMPTDSTNVCVKEGRVIRVRVSKRTQLVEMPDLVDDSQRFAENILNNRGFRYSIEYKPSKEAAGAVMEQLFDGKPIVAGIKIPIGSKIKLIIGRDQAGEPLPLPNLYGLSIVEATQRIESIGELGVYVRCNACLTREDSLMATVFVQSPEYMEEGIVASGSTITIIAAKQEAIPE
ncbi:MAG: PASTA domain-containing protein [Crocinitomicaceae bacterium]|nr:PASTA domain-containing protein [Crocinitomicaceae bacterium]